MIAAAVAESPNTAAIPMGKPGLRAAAPPGLAAPPDRCPARSRARSRARRLLGFRAAIVITLPSASKGAASTAASPAVLMSAAAISISTDAIVTIKGFRAAIPAGGTAIIATAVSAAEIATGPAMTGANFPA